MKKIFLLVIVGYLSLSCGAQKSDVSELEFENGWYFETNSQTEYSKEVKNRFSDKVVYVEPTPIIKASDYSKIGITKQKWGAKEVTLLELVFDGNEKERWADATERMSKTSEKAVFIYKDLVISTVSAFRRMDNGYASVSNENFNEEILIDIETNLKKRK